MRSPWLAGLIPRHGAPPIDPPASERLDSWKEIAVYLRRSVRTVQRWEETESLPVHRHLHDKGGSVYAYRAELDAWWKNRAPRLEATEPAGARGPLARAPAAVLALFGLLLLAVAAGTLWWIFRPAHRAEPTTRTPFPAFEQLDWVLICRFENRTGEPLFDGTLEYALERELGNSPRVRAVPRERIQDALHLMRKPGDSPIDSRLGLEICLRDGDIGALLIGRIEETGSRYLLSVTVREPVSGAAAASFTEAADGEQEVLPAVQRIAERVREALGEGLSSIARSRQALERVTTPSLRALQLYSKADALFYRFEFGAAEELLRQAVSEDSEFASAYILLAYAISNQERREEEYLPFAEKAMALADRATTSERYFIRGSYHTLRGEDEKAMTAYKALLTLAPGHFWANNNLAVALKRRGRPDEAILHFVRAAESRPLSFEVNAMTVWNLAISAGEPARAEPFYRRMEELMTPEDIRQNPGWVMNLRFIPIYRSWIDGNLESALSQAELLAQSLEPEFGIRREAGTITGSWCFASFYATLGRLGAAEEQIRGHPDPLLRPKGLARIAFLRADLDATRAHFERAVSQPRSEWLLDATTVILLARVGLVTQADSLMSELEGEMTPASAAVARGELALARGRSEEARALLEEGTGLATASTLPAAYFLGLESLAHLSRQQGDLEGAVRVLEPTSTDKVRARGAFLQAGPYWLRNRLQLAGLLRELGREDEARRIARELSALLAHADRDHPLLAALESGEPASIEPSRLRGVR